MGIYFGSRQSKNEELTRVRLEYYKSLAPKLNRLMCYMTFIGRWRDDSPPAIIDLKRDLDSTFYSAVPLFIDRTRVAYDTLMGMSFSTFGYWGEDARIRTSAFRRREAWRSGGTWDASWDSFFALGDDDRISKDWLTEYRRSYDALLAQMVSDSKIGRRRDVYTTSAVSANAHDDRSPITSE